eukprot:737861-Prymnesium_polylepis.1
MSGEAGFQVCWGEAGGCFGPACAYLLTHSRRLRTDGAWLAMFPTRCAITPDAVVMRVTGGEKGPQGGGTKP